ncbi:unnamed protein product, partial [Discosporangium mesarthrocarpum]
ERVEQNELSLGNEREKEEAIVTKEWEAVEELRAAEDSVPKEKGVGGILQPIPGDIRNQDIHSSDILAYLRSQDLSVYKALITPTLPGMARRGILFQRGNSLKITNGEKLRDEVFLFSQVHYTPRDLMHRRLIQTVYRRLTGEKWGCPDEGTHWDTIGFQGRDPCTDLNRSQGVFSLLQVLYFLETQPKFAEKLHQLSVDVTTGWPFLCVSIGFTKEAIGALRRGACYSECNHQGRVMEVVHELHQAQFHDFHIHCLKEPATHHAVHLSKVR